MGAEAMQHLAKILALALEQGASDVHLTPGERPALRVQGELRRIDMLPFDATSVQSTIGTLMTERQRLDFEKRLEIDFSFEMGALGRFRVNAFFDRCGVAAALRAVPSTVPSLALLGLPPVVRRFCDRDAGLVLVTGPTGSGKSTTLAAMVDAINANSSGRILTIEDPIEFVHASKRAIVSQRELGTNTHSFVDALRSALREDPDVILVSELRDVDSFRLALIAAETGHLVLSSLHAPNASQTIDRIVDQVPPAQQAHARAQLAACLLGVVTQTLLPRREGGRIAAAEVLVAVPAVRALVREGRTQELESVMQVGQKDGMQTMAAAIGDLVRAGLVEPDDAVAC